jgi:hypothetical protein
MSAEPMSPERLAAAREVVASGMPMANERAADLLAEVDRLRSDQQAIRSVAANMARLNIPDADLLTDAQANRLIEWAGRLAAALSGEHPERNDG